MNDGRAARLLALVRVDTVDSTGTLARDGVEAALRQRRRLAEFVSSAIELETAEVIATEGDGVVIGCGSAKRALAIAEHVRDAALADGLMTRIGATIGEVVIDADTDTDTGDRAATSPGGDLARVDAIERCAPVNEIAIDDRIRRALFGVAAPSIDALEPTDVGAVHRLVDGEPETVVDTRLRAIAFTHLDAPPDGLPAAIARSVDAVAAAGGIIVDSNDAGHVAAFESCSSALAAATAMHADAAASNLRADTTSAISATVSIALGEIAATGDDDFGVAVVEAARLLRFGVQDSTVVSEDVYAIAGPAATGAEAHGLHELKGIPEPVAVYRIDRIVGARPLVDLPAPLARDHRFGFAGRTDLLAVLDNAWTETVGGQVRGVVVSGEEGAGKTRLVREAAHRSFESGAIVLFGACDEDLRVPYASIAEALERAAPLDAAIESATVDGSGALGRLFHAAGTVDVARPAIDRFDLFDAFTEALARVAEQRPVVLVLDDIQWATPETLQIVEHALADPVLSRVMIVATCRSEDLSGDHPVEALLSSSRPGRRIAHLRLPRLDIDDVTAMLESRTGQPLRDDEVEFARQITDATGGSPLFVEELVVHLAATGVLVHDPVDGWRLTAESGSIPMPDSVVSLMSHRTARLGPDAVSVLTTAAVMGTGFDLDVLATVAGRSLIEVLDIVESAESARLVTEDDGGGACSFNDEITRQGLLRELRPSRRALVHRQIAETLEAKRPDRIDELALHWEASIGEGASERAIHFLRLAADRDIASAAFESAVTRLRRVRELLEADGCDDPQVLGEVHYAIGSSARMIGDESHRPDLVTAAGCARGTGDGTLLARCAIGMMRPGAWYPEAAVIDTEICTMCEDALLLLDQADPMRPRVLAALATNLAYDDDVDRRRSLVAEAQQLAREVGDATLIGTTLAAELIISFEPDRFERRWQLANELRTIARRTNDRDLAFTGGLFALLELMMRGEIDAAAELHAELAAISDAHRGYWQRFLTAHFDTAIAIARCAPDASERIERERTEFQAHPVDWFGVSVIQTAIIAMGSGTLADMLLPFAEVVAADDDNDSWTKKWNYAFSKAYHDSGDLESAVRAIESNLEPDFDHYWMSSVYHLGHLGLSLGRADYCQMTIDRLTPYRGRLITIGLGACIAGQVSTALGQAALGVDDIESAEELFREATDQAAALDFPYFATMARRFLATTLLHDQPASEEARDLIERVMLDARHHGFALELDAARDLQSRADESAAPS